VIDMEEAAEEMHRLSSLLDDGLAAMRRLAHEYADTEATYREAQARAWVATPRDHSDGERIQAKEREAMVNAATAQQRRARDLADGMRQAALEAVRSRRGQISALQTRLNVDREAMAFARTGPEG
jgi:hypothetical protein